jgi:hypothetical protein
VVNKRATNEKFPPVIEHVCVPLAALMTKLTLVPAVSVILAPFLAVALILVLVGPTTEIMLMYWRYPPVVVRFTELVAAVELLKLELMLSL